MLDTLIGATSSDLVGAYNFKLGHDDVICWERPRNVGGDVDDQNTRGTKTKILMSSFR